MLTHTTARDLAATLDAWRARGLRWAFVPTMGALHEGHLTLVRRARAAHGRVVVSVFVNPTQFDRADDLARYPRQPARDAELLRGAGADVLYLPGVADVYPDGTAATRTPDLAGLDARYEGASRPGHFDGVVQVVRRLVEVVRPAAMFMGQKDAQQVAVLRRAAAQEFWPVEIVSVPIVREPSGLAMSSRNGQLSPAGFAKAAILYACLAEAATAYASGGLPRDLEAAATARLAAAGLRPEYFDAVDARDFTRLPNVAAPEQCAEAEPLLVAVAWCDGVRLIDNYAIGVPSRAESETPPHAAANL